MIKLPALQLIKKICLKSENVNSILIENMDTIVKFVNQESKKL